MNKVTVSDIELDTLDSNQLAQALKHQISKANHLEESLKKVQEENERKSIEILKLKNVLLMKYMSREQEQSSVSNQVDDVQLKLRQTLTDPSVNLVIIQLKKELDECKRQREEALNELNSYKFTSDSNMGKRLISRVQKLLKENEELGGQVSSGNVSNLEVEVAFHKKLLEEAHENEKNLYTFISEMDKEMDGMQATIFQLQQKILSVQQNV